jgi:hypothetical protein
LTAKEREIEVLRADNADLKIINEARKEKEILLREIIGLKDRQIADLERAGGLDKEAIGELRAQRESYKDELERVRKERDSARSLLRKIGAAAFIGGLIIGAGLVSLLKGN